MLELVFRLGTGKNSEAVGEIGGAQYKGFDILT